MPYPPSSAGSASSRPPTDDPIARGDLRVARERGRDAETRVVEQDRRGLLAGSRRTDADHPGDPRSAPIGPDRFDRERCGSRQRESDADEDDPDGEWRDRSTGRRGPKRQTAEDRDERQTEDR